MRKISSTAELRNSILQLENKQRMQEQEIKEQFRAAYLSIKPISIIKSILKEVVASHEIQEDLVVGAANLVADFVSKQITKGEPESESKKYLGNLVYYGLTTIVTNNSEAIRTIGECFIQSFFTNKKKQEE
jgi:hypothetical protein